MLIPRKDCENDAQKCLISKIRGMMEIVEKAGHLKGEWKSDNYYISSVRRDALHCLRRLKSSYATLE